MADRIQIRRDTAANWTATNPVLAIGEMGYETDTKKIKVGDGATAWNSLTYNDFGAFSGSWNDLSDKPSVFPPESHTHDDRYYTESETDGLLAGKSDTTHNHDADYDSAGTASSEVTSHENTYNHGNIHAPGSDAEDATSIAAIHSGVTADSVADADTFNFVQSVGGLLKKITWSNIKATLKSYFDTLYSAINHDHDSRYYTENETDNLLSGKSDTSHNHTGTYEPVFSKNSAFNKDFGAASGTVCQGNDSRLSDERTPTDNSASYAKIGNDLKGSSALSGTGIDWSAAGVFTKTLTGNTTFSFSNLQLNKVITLVLSGDYVITWPSYMDADHLISGEYDGTTDNYIQIHCTNAGSGTEEVWWSIKTKGA